MSILRSAVCFFIFFLFISDCLCLPSSSASSPATTPPLPSPSIPQNTSTPSGILSTALSFLTAECMYGVKWNISFLAYKPALEKYSPSGWLWDTGAQIIALTNLEGSDMWSNSTLALRSLLKFQQPSGFIPEIIYWGNETSEQIAHSWLMYNSDRCTPFTQSPVLMFSLEAMVNKASSEVAVDLIKEFLSHIVANLDWWLSTRDPLSLGLGGVIHGWESGIDASPAYDEAYGLKSDNYQPTYNDLYPRFNDLTLVYRFKYNWNMTAIVYRNGSWTDNYFFVYDTAVNSFIAASYKICTQLANRIGDSALAASCKKKQENIERSINEYMWIEAENRFASALYVKNGICYPSRAETAQSLFPLLLESLSRERLDRIVNNQLFNQSKFWTSYPIPSVSKSDPSYDPDYGPEGDLMWRGPSWPIQNYYIIRGLLSHSKVNEAQQLFERWLSLVQNNGIYEDYQPETGKGFGAAGLSMSLLIVDAICHFIPDTVGCVNRYH